MRPSLKTVAARAGVSTTAVSLCLNRHPTAQSIPAATRARILRAAEECNYQPHFLAQALSRGRTDSLGLVVADLRIERQANYASAFMELAAARGQSLLVSATRYSKERELQCLAELKERRVDGAIFQFNSLTADTDIHQQCRRDRFPVVKLCPDPYFPYFIPNSGKAMAEAARLFKQDGPGKVYGIVAPRRDRGDARHHLYFKECCRRAGLEAELVAPDLGPLTHHYSDELLRRLAGQPGARFVVHDVYNLERLLHWVEGERRIVTFLDEYDPFVELGSPCIAGIIHSNYRQILAAAVDRLLEWIARPDERPPLRTEIHAAFVSPAEFMRLTDHEGRRRKKYGLVNDP